GSWWDNDLTVINNSQLFDDFLNDIAPVAPFEVNRVTFEKGYYLVYGVETDIRQKDKNQSQNEQKRARNGKT
ncbi:ALP1-like protein isoform X1, partial [Tanacetum coccineum]